MLNLNSSKRISGKELHSFVEVKTNYWMWIKRCIEYADLQENKDFFTVLGESTGGRKAINYEFTIDAAKEMCIVSATNKAKELRRWLISIGSQRENLELITVQEAAFAVQVINALKYIENQRIAYTNHQRVYVGDNPTTGMVYAEFAKYRSNIIGWDKENIDKALENHLIDLVGHNKKHLLKKNMSEKLTFIDVHEAIRVAVLDILYSNGTEGDSAQRFATMVKELSNKLHTKGFQKNENSLFQEKQELSLLEVKNLKLQ